MRIIQDVKPKNHALKVMTGINGSSVSGTTKATSSIGHVFSEKFTFGFWVWFFDAIIDWKWSSVWVLNTELCYSVLPYSITRVEIKGQISVNKVRYFERCHVRRCLIISIIYSRNAKNAFHPIFHTNHVQELSSNMNKFYIYNCFLCKIVYKFLSF